MATITISGLPEVSTILDTSNIPVETVGITQRITGANLKSYLAALPALTATSGNVSGQMSVGTLVTTGDATINGALTATSVAATSGSFTNLAATNISVTGTAAFSANISAQNFNAAQGVYATTLQGTLATAAQPAITSVGTLSALTVTTPIVGSVTGTALTVTQAAQPAITSLGSLTSLNVTGAASVGTLNANTISVSSLTLTSLTSTTINGANYSMSGTFLPTSNGTLNLGGAAAAFGVIYGTTFSGPTHTGTTFTGNTFTGNTFTGTTYNGTTYNGTTFNGTTFSGTATTALYADLAECYEADAAYEPGTVLVFGTDTEVTIASGVNNPRIAGVVSTRPAHLMNSGLSTEFVAEVALQGRVPCKVVGTIKRGDMLTTSYIDGVAMVSSDPKVGTIIGKALQNYDSIEPGVIEVVVGRL